MSNRMRSQTIRRALVFSLLLTLVALSGQPAAYSVSKSEVDRACAASQAQYADYVEARQKFEEAAIEYEAVLNDIEITTRKRDRVSSTLQQRESSMDDVQIRIEDQAVQLYMQGGNTDAFVFFADSVDELITGTEFLAATSESDLGSLDDLLSLRTDMQGFQTELQDLDAQLRETEKERADIVDDTLSLAEEQKAAFNELSSECQSLQAQYEAEQAAGSGPAQGAIEWWWRRWWRRWFHQRVPLPLPGFLVHRLLGFPPVGWTTAPGRRHDGWLRTADHRSRERHRLHRQRRTGRPDHLAVGRADSGTTTPTSATGPFRAGRACRPVTSSDTTATLGTLPAAHRISTSRSTRAVAAQAP